VSARLWLVSPVYQDVQPYLRLRERLLEVSRGRHNQIGETRFVAIDDTGGYDPQVGQVRSLPDVTVVESPFNLGHQRAIVFGLRCILPSVDDDDVLVTLDADGEDRPEDLPRLLDPLLTGTEERNDITVAIRTKRRTSVGFKVLYLFFRILFRLLTGTAVQSGNYAAYRGWLAKRMLRHPHFDLCYSSTLLSLNLPIRFVPCERGVRYGGRSQMGFRKLFVHGLRMMMPFADRIAIRALTLFSATLAVGVVLALAIVGVRLFTDAAIPGWASYTLLGVVILSFVALGNFITLFAVFSQSLGISLSEIDRFPDGRPGSTAPPAD
jgi:polyisoprenyl-phosphate glycosyltransferase